MTEGPQAQNENIQTHYMIELPLVIQCTDGSVVIFLTAINIFCSPVAQSFNIFALMDKHSFRVGRHLQCSIMVALFFLFFSPWALASSRSTWHSANRQRETHKQTERLSRDACLSLKQWFLVKGAAYFNSCIHTLNTLSHTHSLIYWYLKGQHKDLRHLCGPS